MRRLSTWDWLRTGSGLSLILLCALVESPVPDPERPAHPAGDRTAQPPPEREPGSSGERPAAVSRLEACWQMHCRWPVAERRGVELPRREPLAPAGDGSSAALPVVSDTARLWSERLAPAPAVWSALAVRPPSPSAALLRCLCLSRIGPPLFV